MKVWVNVALVCCFACGDDDGRIRDAATTDSATATDSAVRTDAGTLADTGTDAAAALDASDGVDSAVPGGDAPTGPGRATVEVREDAIMRGDRRIPVAAYLPGEPAPLVLFLPGFQLESRRYDALCRRVASHGFVVVRADPPAALLSVSHTAMQADAGAVLDWALGELAVSGGAGAMGHSLGGKVSTMLAGGDARIVALLGIDPVNGGNPFTGYSAELPDVVPAVTQTLSIPVGYLGETTNGSAGLGGMACAPTDQNYATFFEGSTAASSAAEWTFAMADHMDFVPDVAGCGFTCSACPNGGADESVVQAGMMTLATAFFRRHLKAEAAMDAFLVGPQVPAGVTVRSR
ncbi:MAG: hypothetical protein AAGE52_20895 [Myxococcota bacterium]